LIAFENLLSETSVIINKHRKVEKENGEGFNIFTVAGIDEKEVIISRVIAELINRNGCHAQGDKYLRPFVEIVLNCKDDWGNEDYEKASISTEEYISENKRRIDILIKTPSKIIPIEVKINAKDGDAQCHDYIEYCRKFTDRTFKKLYYLTKDGRLPKDYSVLKKGKTENYSEYEEELEELYKPIEPISFKKNIIPWLCECSKKKPKHIQEIIKQMIIGLEKLTDRKGDAMNNEIAEHIEKTESMQAACAISNSLDSVRDKIMKKLFEAFHNEIVKKHKDWKPEKENVPNQKNKFVNIAFKKENTKDLFFIEIERRLYMGIIHEDDKPKNPDEGYGARLKKGNYEYISWHNTNNVNDTPDFVNYADNKPFLRLTEQKEFDVFIMQGMNQISEFLGRASKE